METIGYAFGTKIADVANARTVVVPTDSYVHQKGTFKCCMPALAWNASLPRQSAGSWSVRLGSTIPKLSPFTQNADSLILARAAKRL